MRQITLILILALIIPQLALAQTNPCSSQGTGGNIGQCISQIYLWALGISAILAVLMVVLGGYLYMTAAGNAQQTKKGVEFIWGAIVGLGLLFGAYLILNTINPDLTTFRDFTQNPPFQQTSPPRAP